MGNRKGYKFANKGKKGSNGTGSDDEPVTTVNWRDALYGAMRIPRKPKAKMYVSTEKRMIILLY